MNTERNMLELYPEGKTPDPTPNSNVIDAGTFDSSDPAPSTEETTALAVTDINELPPGIYRNLDPAVVAKRDSNGRFLKRSAAIESAEKTAAFSRGFMGSIQTVLSSSVEALDEPSQTAVEAAAKRLLKSVIESDANHTSPAKNFEVLAKWAGAKSTETAEKTPPVVVVFSQGDCENKGIDHTKFVRPTRPSWVEAELPTLDAEVVSTDSAPMPVASDLAPIPPAAAQRAAEAELARTGGEYRQGVYAKQ
ncbi:MAG: hypothetical protein WB558_07460 [Terriglobales bacterium]